MVKASIVNTDPPNLPKKMGLLVVVVYSVRCSCLCLPGVVAGRQLMVFPPPGCVYGWRAGGGGGEGEDADARPLRVGRRLCARLVLLAS